MATLKDYRDERLKKLSELRALGINPYPAKSYRTHKLKEVSENFETLEGEQATVLGRIVSIRKFGKLAFIVLKDDSGKLQLFLRAGDTDLLNVEEGTVGIEQISLLDTGDYLEATGEIIRTKTGEISLAVKKMKLLAKALRPTPENLADKEERLRRRYLDTKINQNVYERYQRRSKFWQATRDFLNQNDVFSKIAAENSMLHCNIFNSLVYIPTPRSCYSSFFFRKKSKHSATTSTLSTITAG